MANCPNCAASNSNVDGYCHLCGIELGYMFLNAIIAITPIRNTPKAVIFELWHSQPFAPDIEPVKVNHDHN